ncbi:cyanoexosortase A [Myxacorys almedinensis]|uniref:Cyanoexosortase A n=1 Tax=Myxacorys almedinensis A TaxID=2690445 RepID=A0A8J8CLK2_9CYAN|nr:cyanoexosortase A [Myxacorys almedinensis]NDJ16202.1 cyanoexosortase A [Myxacorys almedinensis A]
MPLLRYRARIAQAANEPNYWLLGIALGLVVLHWQLCWRLTGDFNQISLELMGWSGVVYCVWQRRQTIVLSSDLPSRILGGALVALLLVRSSYLKSASVAVLSVNSLAIALAIVLVAVGVKHLLHYQRELWLVAIAAFPVGELINYVDRVTHFSVITAQYSHILMWYMGFPVQRQGVQLLLPTGTVEIYPGCSGLEAALLSLKIAAIFLLVFPTHWRDKVLVPGVAIASALVVNGFRIVLLTYLVSVKNMTAFEFWHSGAGSQVFSLISMSVFSHYCQQLMPSELAPELAEQPLQGAVATSRGQK